MSSGIIRTSSSTMEGRLVSARTAMEILGVRSQTLYAYVSRGLIVRIKDPVSNTSSFYEAELKELAARRSSTKRPSQAALSSLHFGLPVLNSRISSIHAGRLYYRDHDTASLAFSSSLEDVAALLWRTSSKPDVPAVMIPTRTGSYSETLMHWLAEDASNMPHMAWTHEAVLPHAWRIVQVAVAIAAGVDEATGPIHERVGEAWGVAPAQRDLLRMAFVLMAEHELNNSTFVVRCVASTLANPYAAILAGCCSLSGQKHGNVAHSYELIASAAWSGDITSYASRLVSSGQAPIGFGHHAYACGDPRASLLLSALPDGERSRAAIAVAEIFATRMEKRPRVDFALAAIAYALNLPKETGQILFLLPRIVGWLAHVMEQYQSPYLIRPRAGVAGGP